MNRDVRSVVIGLGNRCRGDDAAGLIAADFLRAMELPGIDIITGIADGTSLISKWEGVDCCVVVDCIASDGRRGAIHRFDAADDPLPANLFTRLSTHSFSLPEAIELARAIGKLPDRFTVFGIEGHHFELGAAVDARIREAAQQAALLIREELTERAAGERPGR